MKINALKAIDHYAETILFEFKNDSNFKSAAEPTGADEFYLRNIHWV